ncbi:PEP-CTERM sorting domain-containing protein [Thalassotalea euphylliae]|uniref:PEP-CTERM sorting domain-containing protein n=1 Tax=Thalassotalea euphylliae TaxID=1655234 RepID=A0A3E0TVT5_9GAMM|nr:PEP-CTERM sorting domain-containing protein [Thalassotalea euphylliae]REL28564.1 PEP-CTERM sorting domain-containing protein [Thalassotalea euphylliae]
MKIKHVLIGGALALGLSANASAVNVGGVVWEPSSLFDWTSNSNLIEDLLDPGPDGIFGAENAANGADDVVTTLSGFGIVTGLNNTNQGTFCPSCELTYEFGGFELSSVIPQSPGADLGFTGGWIRFYVDNPLSTPYDGNDRTTANDGTLWLALSARDQASTIHPGLVSIEADLSTFGGGGDAGTGAGALDVDFTFGGGGLAANNFDTNTQVAGTDVFFSTSFQPIPGGATPDGLELFGTADFRGASTIPEPSSIALIGLAMLGFAGLRRRKH